jgi:hypothetical protein
MAGEPTGHARDAGIGSRPNATDPVLFFDINYDGYM